MRNAASFCRDRARVWKKYKTVFGNNWKSEVEAFLYAASCLSANTKDADQIKNLREMAYSIHVGEFLKEEE